MNVWTLTLVKSLQVWSETAVNRNRSKFSNRTVKHSNRAVIACNSENENHFLSVYPQEANTVKPPLSGPLLSGNLHCPDSPNWSCGCSLLTIMKFGLDKSTRR